MKPTVQDVPERSRYEISVDGEVAGFVAYQESGDVRDFVHTEVDERFRGKGLASTVVRRAVADVRERGLRLVATCPYVRSWLEKHPDEAAAVVTARTTPDTD